MGGALPVLEIMIGTDAIRNLIGKGRISSCVRNYSSAATWG
jgi:Tfp pilus assembly pilus retraction ATPase PilT